MLHRELGSDLFELMDAIPAFDAFPVVDAQLDRLRSMAEAHPDVCSLMRVGSSQLGEPLMGVRIEGGPRQAVCFGAPHPNEPIGCLTALELVRTLCENTDLRTRLGVTWSIVPCADPDGMRLNEAWFTGPLTRTSFGRNFYRPAGSQQVEWTFPQAYKDVYFDRALPETTALMRLIDQQRPALLCPLHNSELGGAYYYVSREAKPLYPTLHAIAEHCSIPLDLGEPETPSAPVYADAVFGMSTIEAAYEYAKRMGRDPSKRRSGASSAGYARRYGTFSIISETPYWTHPSAADRTPISTSYADVLRRRADGLEDLSKRLTEGYDRVRKDVIGGFPFARATEEFGPGFASGAAADRKRSEEPEAQRPATVAERFSCEETVHSFRVRFAGMFLRLLETQIASGNGTPAIRREQQELAAVYRAWCEEAEAATPAEPIPIRSTVALQYGAVLAAAAHVAYGD